MAFWLSISFRPIGPGLLAGPPFVALRAQSSSVAAVVRSTVAWLDDVICFGCRSSAVAQVLGAARTAFAATELVSFEDLSSDVRRESCACAVRVRPRHRGVRRGVGGLLLGGRDASTGL